MNIYKFLLNYIILVSFESIWFFYLAKDFYEKNIGFLLKEKLNLLPIIIFYFIYIFAYQHFVLRNFSKIKNFLKESFLFSLTVYSASSLINYACIYRWKLDLALVDLSWGIFVTTFSGYLTMKFYKKFFVK